MLNLFRIVRVLSPLLLLAALATPAGAQNTPPTPGRSTYIRECAICHGLDMKGRDADWRPDSPFVPPLDYSGKAWRLTDMELQAILRAGSHATAMRLSNISMPPFAARLNDSEVDGLIAYLKDQWTAAERGHQVEATRRATLPPAAVAALGAQLYGVKCAICHGPELRGQINLVGEPGQEREVRVPALRHDILAQALSDARLRAIINEGEAHHPIPHSEYRMPGFQLSENEAQALVLYLREVWRGGTP